MKEDNVFMKFLDLDKPKPEPVDKKITPKISKVYNRSMGDVYAPAEAQRIFNPGMPSAAKPKAPTAAQMGAGTTAAMDTTGRWGTAGE